MEWYNTTRKYDLWRHINICLGNFDAYILFHGTQSAFASLSLAVRSAETYEIAVTIVV